MIEIKGLTVVYGRTVALRDLTLSLPAGVTGVFGPNGSGKSTLLRAIAALIEPVAGSIEVDGFAVGRRDEARRGLVGYAGHLSGLYPHLSLGENLDLFATLHGSNPGRPREICDVLGLGERLEMRVSELSAGFKRRAAVARALLHDPQILLLDEPYANLDDEAADAVTTAIVGWRGPGRVALVASHGAKRVKSYANSSLILQRGVAVSHRVAEGAAP